MKIFKSGIQANTGRVYNLKSWAIFRSIPTSWRTKLSFFSLFSFFFYKIMNSLFSLYNRKFRYIPGKFLNSSKNRNS